MASVQLRRDGAVARIVLDRPDALNALDLPMIEEFGDALDECRQEAVRVVVVTGSGRAFCAGGDVHRFAESLDGDPSGYVRDLATAMHERMILPIRRLPKPVIASINGTAAGGGLSLALACDLRIAASEARLTTAYSSIALAADGGSSYFLPRLVGPARAAELLFLAEVIDGRRAQELGLVNQVVPAADLEAATAAWAARLAERPVGSLAETKALLARSEAGDLEAQLVAEVAAMARLAGTTDYRDAVRAFTRRRRG
jgi:2-(1,2-epoxy-1,2-dihydrophenyl)acetyl-CoA isomerase